MGIAQIIAPTLDSDGEFAAVGRAALLGIGVAAVWGLIQPPPIGDRGDAERRLEVGIRPLH
jgi:hypothetical protein